MPLPQGSEPTVADLLLDGRTALFLDGHAAAVPLLRGAIAALQADLSDSPELLYWLGIGCWAAGAVGDDAGLHALGKRLEGKAREQGALVPLSIGLLFLAMSELFDGSLTTARAHFTERAEIIAAIGRPADVGDLVMLAWADARSRLAPRRRPSLASRPSTVRAGCSCSSTTPSACSTWLLVITALRSRGRRGTTRRTHS